MVDMANSNKGTGGSSASQRVNEQLHLLESSRRLTAEEVQELQQQEMVIRQENLTVSTARKIYNQVNIFGESMEDKIKRSRRELKERRAQEKRTKKLEKIGKNMLGLNGDVRVVLVGKTGIGKSHLGSNLLKTNVFKYLMSLMSVTKQCKFGDRCLDDATTLLVVDTPGLFDTREPNEQTSKEIVRSIALTAPGPHIYIFVISVGRFTPEEADTVNILQEMFGEQVIKHVIIVFTRKDDLDGYDSPKDFILNSPPVLQNLLERCGYRFAFINNKAHKDEIQEDVDFILDLIYKTIGENNGAYYTNDSYEKADEVLEVRRKEIRSEKERRQNELKEERDQIFNQATNENFGGTDGNKLLKDTQEAENMLEEKRRRIQEIEEQNRLLTQKMEEEAERLSALQEQKKKIREHKELQQKEIEKEENKLRELDQEQKRLREEDKLRRQEIQKAEEEKLKQLEEDRKRRDDIRKAEQQKEEDRLKSLEEERIKFYEEEAAKKRSSQIEEERLRDLEEKQKRLREEDAIRRKEMEAEAERLKKLEEMKRQIVHEDRDSSLSKTLLKLTEINEKLVDNAKINPNREVIKEVENNDSLVTAIGSAVYDYGSSAVAATVGWLKSWW
ncbi:golgin subfamily A member 6-like protein 1 [Patella vulgata]|uniref:golgin subfamily A member 6-like protein 1 n=1 Tax=Patella vulgata TaxID=6465 RepID=UPI0021800ADE|nr:golgin subfamily A member 6-like protein 1 [Patella vulgata]